ncbi:eight-cysteine-cluster domain-containing protein [Candidatus Woesearchaeota archaeon]|nr:eight-cysteine-cluster domain-containing protein [Candidatus Woesearchaeota archaeon]
MKPGVILLPLLILISGCSLLADNKNKNIECASNSDCAVVGCSSQLCVSADKASEIITTCEYREEYSCLKLTSCDCINNKCQWLENDNYNECLEEVRG